MSSRPRELRPIVTYPRDAILETVHVAAALGLHADNVPKLDLPCFYIGNRARYLWGQVLDVLAERAMPDQAEAPPAKRAKSSVRRSA